MTKQTSLEKAAIMSLFAFIIIFAITVVGGLFFVVAAAAGITNWTIVSLYGAIGGLLSVLCLMSWFIFLMIQITKE